MPPHLLASAASASAMALTASCTEIFSGLAPNPSPIFSCGAGTILGTARAPEIETEDGRSRAAEQMAASGLDGLVVIGGEGTLRAGQALYSEHGCKIVAIPATIDNDIAGADMCIGFDTGRQRCCRGDG